MSAYVLDANWRKHAACRDEDPELFFPVGTTGPALLQVEQAKAVCRRCSVTDECLAWALETGEVAGVWGGMSEDERRALLARRNAKRDQPLRLTGSLLDKWATLRALEPGITVTAAALRIGCQRQSLSNALSKGRTNGDERVGLVAA